MHAGPQKTRDVSARLFHVLVASAHQNSMWWNRSTSKRSVIGLWRLKLAAPTNWKPFVGIVLPPSEVSAAPPRPMLARGLVDAARIETGLQRMTRCIHDQELTSQVRSPARSAERQRIDRHMPTVWASAPLRSTRRQTEVGSVCAIEAITARAHTRHSRKGRQGAEQICERSAERLGEGRPSGRAAGW